MINRLRAAILLHHLPQHEHVALLIFLLTENRSHHLAGAIIDPADQREPGTSLLQPMVRAGIDLDQLPFLPIACPPQAMLGPLGRLDHQYPFFLQDPSHTGSRNLNLLAFFQQISQMMLITTRVLALSQLAYLLAYLFADAPRTPFPAVAMHHRFYSSFSITRLEPINMALATLEQGRHLRDAQVSTQMLIQDVDSFLFLRVQCHCFVHT